MKRKTRTRVKRWLAMVLCLCMIFSSATTFAFAAGEEKSTYADGLCEHHPEHTAECGYAEAVEGQPCNHVHDENCGYQESVPEVPCDKQCTDSDGDGIIDHQSDCAYQAAVEAQPCTHQHDETCGYQEASEAKPCTFVCDICSQEESQTKDSSEELQTENVPQTESSETGTLAKATQEVSVQVQFTGTDQGTIAPGSAFSLTMALANNTASEVEISIPLETESEHLQISGLKEDGTITVGQSGQTITLTYDADQDTLKGKLPAGYNSTGTISMLFSPGVTPTGEKVTVGTPEITSGYDGENSKLEAIGTTEVTTKTKVIDWSTSSGGYPQNFPLVGSGTDQYIQIQTVPANEAGSGASYTASLTVTQKVTFAGFKISGLTTSNAGDYININHGGGTITEASESGYTVTWVLTRAEDASGDLTVDKVNSLDSSFMLDSCTATTGSQSIQVESDVTAEPLLSGYGETNLDNNKSTHSMNSRAETTLSVNVYGEEACENEKLVFTAGETIYYKVTATINGDAGTYTFNREGFENLGQDQIEKASVVSLKVNEEPQQLPGSTHGISVDLEAGSNTVELIYAFQLKENPQGLKSGDQIDGKFSVMKSPQTLSTATQRVAYVVTEDADSGLDLRKTASDSKNGDTIVYALTVSNENKDQITTTVYDDPWPCEVFVLTDVQAPDGAIVEYEFADGRKTLVMPGEDAQPADKGTGLTKITVYNVPVEAEGETQVYLTAKERVGITAPFTVSNKAGLPGQPGTTCNLILATPLTKQAYWDADCKDEITATETVKADDTVYYKITLENNGENTRDTWFTLHDVLPEGMMLVKTVKDGASITPDSTENGEIVFPAVQVPEEGSATWILECKVTEEAVSAAQEAGTANLRNTAYVRIAASGTEYAQTPDAFCEITIAGMEQATVTVKKTLEAVYRDMNIISGSTGSDSLTLNPYPYNLGKTQTVLGPGNYAVYGIRISNADSSNPVPVYQVRDALPEGMEYVGLITPNDGLGLGFVNNKDYNSNLEVKAGKGHATHNQSLKATLTTQSKVGATGQITWDVTPYNSEGTHYIQPGESMYFFVLAKVNSLPSDNTYENTAEAKTAVWVKPGSGTTEAGTEEDGKWLRSTLSTAAGTFKPSILKEVTGKKASSNATVETDALPVVGQSDWVRYRVTVGTASNASYLSNFKLVDTLPDGYSYVEGTAVFATTENMINHQTYLTSAVDGQTLTLTFPEQDTTGIRGLTQAQTAYIEYWVKPTNGTQNNSSSENIVKAVFDHAFTEVGTCTSYDLDEHSITSSVMTYALGDMAMLSVKNMVVDETEYGPGSGIATVSKGQEIEYKLNVTSYLGSTYTLSDLSLTDTLPYLGDSRNSGVKVNVEEGADVKVYIAEQEVANKYYKVTIKPEESLQQPSRIQIDFTDEFVSAYEKQLQNNGKITVSFPATVIGGSSNIAGINDFVLNYHATPENGEAFILSVTSNQVAVIIPGTSTDTEGADTSLWISKNTVAEAGSSLPELEDGMFTFTISAKDNAPLPEKTTASYRASDKKVIFDPISYEKAGTYVYTIKEDTPGEGWTNKTGDITATVKVIQDSSTGQLKIESITYKGGEGSKANQVINEYADTTIDIKVKKVWTDNDNQDGKRPNEVTVTLLENGKTTGKTLTLNEDNNWEGSFTDLPEFKDEVKISYSVQESPVNGYTAKITGDASTGFTITNTHTPETITIEGSKTWDDNNNQDGKRPDSITIRLYADGAELTEKALTVTEEDGWKWSFTDLPKYAEGKEIVYTITEDTVTGYTSEVNGFNVTNSYTPGKTNVTVTKAWNDADDQDGIRPESITVKLLADGQDTGKTLVLNTENSWTGSFTGLDQYKAGKKIVYTIEEVKVEGYETSITGDAATGFTITNTHTPETTDIEGEKKWDDNNNQDGKRPTSITIRLYADGTELTEKALTVTEEAGWKWSFTGLPKYAEGKEIVYTITEDAVPGYTSEIKGFDVTNSYTPGKTNVTVTKAWADNNNQDGIRPESITVKLLADGQDTGKTLVLNTENSWTGSFTGLDQYKAGKEIAYTIEEVKVEGYETSITGDAATGFTITNSHTPETIDISGSKTWDDADNQDGKRPESIIIRLYADGTEKESKEVTAADGWNWSFSGLSKYAAGKEIVYTIEEVKVEGYETSITGDAATGFTITNSHTPETIDIEGEKKWDDNNNQDGKRPTSITIRLYADGTELTEKALTVTEKAGWKWSFTGLPKYADGKEIVYTITEDTVPGYTSEIKGFDVTNSYTPGKTNVTVTKAWADNNDQDGIRPESITVKLLADGQDTGKTLVLNTGNSWTGSFTGLDQYKAGKEIAYTIEEVTVEGYETSITGDASTGFTITNSHTPETIDISGSKTWDDADNQDGKRPTSITIRLYADGTELTEKALTVTEEDGWTWNFTGLPKYAEGKEIVYTISEDTVDGYTPTYTDFNITNKYTPEQTSVKVTKAWGDNNNQDGIRPESITVKLLADGEETGKTLILSDGNGWTDTFSGLDQYKAGKEIAYTIEEVKVEGYETSITGDASTGFSITNSHTPETIAISGSKTWDDADNQDGKRPESITIRLYADGAELTEKALTVTEEAGWKWSFTDLPKYAEGKEIVYTITEDAVPGYTSEIKGFDVTNSYTPGKTNVTVTKAWADNNDQDGIRPESITVKLLADGEETGKTLILSDGNNWTGSFTGLDQYKAGKEIAYTIEEVTVEGYETSITGDASTGFTITNSHTPETIDISGSKTWDDADNQDGKRPGSITIRLYADGAELTEKALTVTEEEGWTWNFTDLPKYADGKEIVYTISEDTVDGYTPTYTDFNITNKYTPEQTSVKVTKAWGDNNNQDGIRPESITVKLLADGEETGKTLILSDGNNWIDTFTGLDKYKDGKEIAYTVEEAKVDGYETSITGDASTGFSITNSHTPETVNVSGSKTWDDADNQDGKRPESITIRLYADGAELTEKALTVTEEDGWTWNFTDLPKYAEGKEIVYTITEDAVPGYTSEIKGFDVTNSYTPGKTSVTVTKAWKDAGDQDGMRPNEITVELLANGESTGQTLKLNEKAKWTGTFADLDEYADGEKIVYTVREASVDGYDSVITGDASTGFVITNSHTPAQIDLSGSKTWDDADNQDGKRPDSITVRLYADGKQVKAVTVTAEESWKWSFNDLPKYENGREICYTITEDVVSGYQSEINGMNVTNHYTPGKINIPVTKNWQDKNDADGIRPDSITVKLYADGKDTGKELILNRKNNWTGSFDGLDEYADGEKIRYTISEAKVDGYDTVISGNAERGFVISNSHTPAVPVKPDKPDASAPSGGTPQTGDSANLPLWLGLLAVSGAGLTTACIWGKKKSYRKKHMK